MLVATKALNYINAPLHSIDTHGGATEPFGDLDKRSGQNFFQAAAEVASTTEDVAKTIANSMGIHSPYFVIGEIPENEKDHRMGYLSYNGIGVYRAITSGIMNWKTKQRGVIIDCLGDMSGTYSVEFTSKPLFYLSNSAIDSRIRNPAVLRATVAVSNYLHDDLVQYTANVAAATDPTGLMALARDNLLYGGLTRAQYALNQLRWLMESGAPFTVYTPHGYYENMLIKSISPRTTDSSLDMLLCDIVYQEAIMTAPYLKPADLTSRSPTRVEKSRSTIDRVFGENSTWSDMLDSWS